MKLSNWCRKVGISYQTGWNLWKAGKLPIPAFQLKTGTIIVEDVKVTHKPTHVVIYARVSSSENKSNLDSQAKRLIAFSNAKGLEVHQVIKEIGSGLNDKRKKLLNVLAEGKATHIIVEHKDRLARFGVEYIKLLCEKQECELIIVNPTLNDRDDLIADFISIITSYCARIYGQRRSKRNTEKLIHELEITNEETIKPKGPTVRSKKRS